MARLLIVTSREKGHTNPMVGVAQWLLADGHDVAWLCLPEPSEQIRSLGVQPLAWDGPELGEPEITGGQALADLVEDPPRLRAWIGELLIDGAPTGIDVVKRALQGFEADVLVSDPMLYAAVIAAHELGIPYGAVSSSLNPVVPDDFDSELRRTIRSLSTHRARLFNDHGMNPDFRVCDCLSPLLTVVFSTPAFVGDASVPDGVRLVGPSVPRGTRGDEVDFPWDQIDPERPLAYASFGSQISWQPERFNALVKASADLNVQWVFTVGDLVDTPWFDTLPANVFAVRYAPQLQLLQRSALVVTHGGANSVMETLRAGVPILINPVCNDQPLQAHFIQASGTGRVVELKDAPQDLPQILEAMLAPEAPERRRAQEVARDYASHDGAQTAARALAALAR